MKMNTQTQHITPAQAKLYLSKPHPRQRPLMKSRVVHFARLIKTGQFHYTHQGIAIDTDGNLIDGQHRLHAIIETGTPATIQVSTGVSNHAWHAIDIGAKRRIGDISGIPGRESEVYRLALNLTCHITNPTAEEIIEVSNSQFGEAVKILLQHCGTARKILSSAPMKAMAAAWFCETGDMYSLSQYRALVNVNLEDMSHQIKVFQQQLLTGRIHSSNRIDLLCRAYLIFDNSRKNEKKLMIHNISDFTPKIRDMIRRYMHSTMVSNRACMI